MTTFETFLRWEERSRDTIDFKKAYVDMTGDVVAALMLSQIVFWHLPDKNGDDKLRVERGGHLWLVKSRDDWWEECRLSPREADRSRKTLEGLGIIEVRLYKFNGAPTQHIRIIEERFLELWEESLNAKPTARNNNKSNSEPANVQRPIDVQGESTISDPIQMDQSKGKALKCPISRNGEIQLPGAGEQRKSFKSPISPNGEIHLTKRVISSHETVITKLPIGEMHFTNTGTPITETTTKTTTENTAAALPKAEKNDADGFLLENEAVACLLMAKGVGRTIAYKLASTKPEICLRYLEYLPYAKVKTSQGAWLANAIKHEYGPPDEYTKAKSRPHVAHVTSRVLASGQDTTGKATKKQELVTLYTKTQQTQPGAFLAFQEHLSGVKERAKRIAEKLSPNHASQYLAGLESEDRILDIFEDWLRTTSPVLRFSAKKADHCSNVASTKVENHLQITSEPSPTPIIAVS